MKFRQAVALAALTALCACALWDQNTFQPVPPAPPRAPEVRPPGPPVDTRTPLLTIGFATENPDYRDQLAFAVGQAKARRPGVQFDVVSVVPAQGDPAAQALAAKRGSDAAVQVMRAMMALGVPDTTLHLGARAEPGLAEPQVRVYIR
ncbi:MAG: hypothetical protein JSR21_13230 [Proteobacteria bacterium]|nr:hypothetical protein [Pseudomonadota bacterium]